jgi:hypothetical protein
MNYLRYMKSLLKVELVQFIEIYHEIRKTKGKDYSALIKLILRFLRKMDKLVKEV